MQLYYVCALRVFFHLNAINGLKLGTFHQEKKNNCSSLCGGALTSARGRAQMLMTFSRNWLSLLYFAFVIDHVN